MTLSIGSVAPDFEATTTAGPIRFHEWIGDSWAVLFSHPKDYTPVCTTELGAVAGLKGEFDKRNVKVIGVSVDPLDSHQGWAGDIGEVGGTELNYPIIADEDRKVAEAYDMIHPGEGDTSTVGSVFVIAPDNTVKLSLTYPKSTGRNFDEIVRVIDSLQVTSAHGLSTPVQWEKGDKVIVPPTVSTDDAKEKYGDVDEKKPYLRYIDEPA